MHTKWLQPEPRIQPPEPIHSLPGLSFAVMKRQISKKSPKVRKDVFILKSHRTNPYK